MSDERIAKQVATLGSRIQKKRGWPRVTWQYMVRKDIEKINED